MVNLESSSVEVASEPSALARCPLSEEREHPLLIAREGEMGSDTIVFAEHAVANHMGRFSQAQNASGGRGTDTEMPAMVALRVVPRGGVPGARNVPGKMSEMKHELFIAAP